MTLIVGITAMKGVGKSTLASMLAELIPSAEIIAFADALREEVYWVIIEAGAADVTMQWLEDHKATVYGPLLQGWGELRRQTEDAYYWIDRLEARISRMPAVIVPDVRYSNEAEFVHQHNGLLVAIHGPSRWEGDTRSSSHPSEANVATCQALADIAVHNEGTLDDLRSWAELIVKELANRGK